MSVFRGIPKLDTWPQPRGEYFSLYGAAAPDRDRARIRWPRAWGASLPRGTTPAAEPLERHPRVSWRPARTRSLETSRSVRTTLRRMDSGGILLGFLRAHHRRTLVCANAFPPVPEKSRHAWGSRQEDGEPQFFQWVQGSRSPQQPATAPVPQTKVSRYLGIHAGFDSPDIEQKPGGSHTRFRPQSRCGAPTIEKGNGSHRNG